MRNKSTMLTADTISQALDGKRSGDGFICLCPAHADTNRSLSVTPHHNGGLPLVYCHAGCPQEAVIESLKRRGLWPSNGNGSGMTIVETYDYTDAQGKMIFQVCRLDPKSFRQRRPDGAGGWIWDIKGVEKVPYRLPQVLKADTVYLVEGEKDVHSLEKLGLVATTNPGGAGKWRAYFNPHLQDKHVIILPDNDDPGRVHAQDVAQKIQGTAASVKIVELPGLPEKGDVSDWMKAGGNIKELEKIVISTPNSSFSLNVTSLDRGYIKTKSSTREGVVTKVKEALKAANIDPAVIAQVLDNITEPASDKTLAQKILEWTKLQPGYFLVTDCYNDLSLVTNSDKNAARVNLRRLVDKHEIEECGNRRGCYRPVDKEAAEINWWNSETELSFKLEMPFDLHSYVKILPKNVIVCAGTTNSGKTAFLLNVARLNVNHAPINYLFLEADGGELRERLGKFETMGLCPLDTWRRVHFRERSANFHQVIEPEAINIVDYLELTGDFFRVAEEINNISKRLTKGLAFIGLQKKPGEDYGVGGHYSAFRSRLYLAMDTNRVKVVKAKVGLGNQNLKDKVFRFDLIQGSKFILKD